MLQFLYLNTVYCAKLLDYAILPIGGKMRGHALRLNANNVEAEIDTSVDVRCQVDHQNKVLRKASL